MAGASLLKFLKFGFGYTSMEWVILIVGTMVAFVVSIFVIKFLMNYIKKHDFKVFGWYRIALGIFATIFVIAYVYTVLDNFFTSVVLNFFIPEQKEDELEGLYTDSKYLRDPDTGEMYTWPELIKVLNDDNACEPNLWERIKEGLGIYGDEFKDPCALMRYIKKAR